jgi:predicted transcriptional regulator
MLHLTDEEEDLVFRIAYRGVEKRKDFFCNLKVVGLYDLLVAITHMSISVRPFDLLSLSSWAEMPRTTCQRHIQTLINMGFVDRKKIGRRYLLITTDTGRHKIIHHVLRHFKQNVEDSKKLNEFSF